MNEINLQALSEAELKKYLSDNRNNSQQFSAGLQELMNRDIWTNVNVDKNAIEEENILKAAIDKANIIDREKEKRNEID